MSGQTNPMISVPTSAGKSRYEGLKIVKKVIHEEPLLSSTQTLPLSTRTILSATLCTISKSWLEKNTAKPCSRVNRTKQIGDAVPRLLVHARTAAHREP